jgi:hypothetical protein
MNDIGLKIKFLRDKAKRVDKPDDYIAAWHEKDRLETGIEKAFVLILRTNGCFWAHISGCSMCGYFNDTNISDINYEHLEHQLEKALKIYNNEKLVKIYTSGSFLDDREVAEPMQFKLLDSFSNANKIVIESRPEFVTEKKLEKLNKYKEKLIIALGLECASDEVLKNSINKGFTINEYKRAARLLNKYKMSLKTYILVKPPYVTEKDAIEYAVNTANFAAKYSSYISFNPVNVQSFTLIEELWKEGFYRSPWLWSMIEILKRTAELGIVVSYPTGSFERGAHNCKKCNEEAMCIIKNFSLTQDKKILEQELNCECKEYWKEILIVEDYTFQTVGKEAEFDKFKNRAF